MEESEKVQTLKVLADAAKSREQSAPRTRLASVRVSPGGYLATASVLTFVAALLLRSNHEVWALVSVATAWLVLPPWPLPIGWFLTAGPCGGEASIRF